MRVALSTTRGLSMTEWKVWAVLTTLHGDVELGIRAET